MVAPETEPCCCCCCLEAAEAGGALSVLSVLREFLICRLFELFHSKLVLIQAKLIQIGPESVRYVLMKCEFELEVV